MKTITNHYIVKPLNTKLMNRFTLALFALVVGGVLSTHAQTDVTSYVISNPSFETGSTLGWTVGSSSDTGARSTTDGTYKMSNSDGAYLFNTWWKGIPIKQTLGKLPAGTYTLSAVVASDGATIYMMVNDDHSSYVESSADTSSVTYKTVGQTLSHTFTLDEATEVTIGIVGGANGTAGEHKDYTADGYWWYKCDNFKLTYTGEATVSDFLSAKKEQLAKQPCSTSLLDAITSASTADAAAEAIIAAEKSIGIYQTINSGTISTSSTDGWTKTTTNGALACNTWSTEGNSDGSGMTTPFIQDWAASGTALGEGQLSYTLSGLNAGEKYTVSALVRAFNEEGTGVTGATYFVGDDTKGLETYGSATTGDYSSKGLFGTLSCTGEVGSDGTLTFGVKLSAESPINWLAIKDVKIAESKGTVPTAITLDQSSVSLTTGSQQTLTATITPTDADDQTVTWESTNTGVATVSGGVITAVGAGTTTITATATAGTDVKATCEVTVADAAAPANVSEIGDGKYLIVNAATGKFLGQGNTWGTQATLTEHGVLTTVALYEGTYKLTNIVTSSTGLGDNGFVDNGSPVGLTATKQDNGAYTLAYNNAYVTAQAGSTVISMAGTDATSSYAQWYFISEKDALKTLKAATTGSPVDATYYILDPNFSRNYPTDAWTVDADNKNLSGGGSQSGDTYNQCAESYHSTFNVNQTITVPNGTYKLRAQACENVASPVAVVYATSGETTNTTAFQTMTNSENGMSACSVSFTAGKYYTDWVDITVENNSLTVGVKSTSAANWCVWDNFELYATTITDQNATEDELTALSDAITAAESKLGFEADEYAPYKNVDNMKALAAAKAINTETASGAEVTAATAAIASNKWTANTEEVNAIAGGELLDSYTHYDYDYANGWSNGGYNTRIMGINEGTVSSNPGLAGATNNRAILVKFNTSYGDTIGYTLPLKASTTYKFSFTYGLWNEGGTITKGLTVTTPNGAEIAMTPSTVSKNEGNTDNCANKVTTAWYTYEAYFTTTDAGNYVLNITNPDGNNQRQMVFADLVLKKAVASDISLDETETSAPSLAYGNVTYARTFATGWNSIVLPFATTKAELGADEIAAYTGTDDTTINLATTDTLKANTPYLVYFESAPTSIKFNEAKLVNPSGNLTVEDGGTTKQYNFVGTYAALAQGNGTITDGDYIVVSTGIKETKGGNPIKAFRAYFDAQSTGATAKRMVLSIDGDVVTAIDGVSVDSLADDDAPAYNIAGQRVGKSYKGVVVKNGKKIIRK